MVTYRDTLSQVERVDALSRTCYLGRPCIPCVQETATAIGTVGHAHLLDGPQEAADAVL